MENLNQKKVGYLLIVFSVLLFIILTAVKINLDAQGAFLCEIISEDPDLDMSQCPAHQDNSSWLVLLGYGVALLIFVSALYLIFTFKEKGNEKKERQEQSFDISKLDEDETKVISYIKEQGGSVYQSDIATSLELSKVKVTRVLDSLEHKYKLVERKRRGMTNIVVLNEK